MCSGIWTGTIFLEKCEKPFFFFLQCLISPHFLIRAKKFFSEFSLSFHLYDKVLILPDFLFFTEESISRKPNFEPYHPEDEPDDEELEEDDIVVDDKEKKKNKFVDDEAEVSYDEEENVKDIEEEDSDFEQQDAERNSSGIEAENETEDDENSADDVEGNVCEDAQHSNEKGNEVPPSTASDEKNNFKKPPKIAPIFKYNITAKDLG